MAQVLSSLKKLENIKDYSDLASPQNPFLISRKHSKNQGYRRREKDQGNNWKKGKDPHPQDKSQQLDFTKDPRPLYYKIPPCVFYHKNVRSKAVFGP